MPRKTLYTLFLKRFFDIALSLVALVILSPVILVLALLIRFKLGSPILFKQARPGKDEKIFNLYKFRTMTDARDENGELLSDSERLTRFGEFIRSTSLDELPGLLNVLKGDMSLVGPRPLLIKYLDYYTIKEKKRHLVRPGLTGWAQVNGRNTIEWDEKLRLDIFYVENISLLLDFKICIKTVKKVLFREDVQVGEEFIKSIGGFVDQRREKPCFLFDDVSDGEVSLRKFAEKDIALKVDWINNPENNQHLHYDIPISQGGTLKWFVNRDEKTRLDLIIEYKGIPVGLIGLVNVDLLNSKAEFYISMGETRFKRKGIATRSIAQLLNFVFQKIKLKKIYLNTDSENVIAQKLFEKAGFVKEGFFEDDMLHRGEYIGRVRYAILSKNYKKD